MRQGAFDEAVNLAVRQGLSRPQLKRDPLGGGVATDLRSSRERVIIVCEGLTVAWCLYAAAFWMNLVAMRVPDLWVVPLIDKLLKALLAGTLAWATLRRKPWAPWGVVIFAAYMGVPTLDHLYSLATLWSGASGSHALSALFQVTMETAQFVALVLGLKLVTARTAA